jgi:ADP-heptose:LPS heptosyltransferase
MTTANRMLVAAPERWDEACFAVPAVRALAAAGMEVGVLCVAGQVDFWRTLEGIEVKVFDGKPDVSSWDTVLAWEVGAMAKALRKAGAARRIAPAGDKALEKWATDPVKAKVRVLEHRVRYFLATVEALGVATREARLFAAAEMIMNEPEDVVLLCPDSDFGPSHEWPLERWVELAHRLREDHGQVIEVASVRGDRRFEKAIGGAVPFVDATVLAPLLRRFGGYRLVVAADGSLPHVAAHAGATCVVLFGPNDPGWRRPLGKRHTVVKHHVECAPCLMPKCRLDMRCQQRLEVDVVLKAILDRLADE